jgi:SAM-dependent methyltransferase
VHAPSELAPEALAQVGEVPRGAFGAAQQEAHRVGIPRVILRAVGVSIGNAHPLSVAQETGEHRIERVQPAAACPATAQAVRRQPTTLGMGRPSDEYGAHVVDTPYFAAEHATADERQRLSVLQSEFDPLTMRHLRDLGLGTDRRVRDCLEVAAGGGSIARFMADAVAPDGRVVATDLDLRFLAEDPRPNLEVRRHDLVTEPLEPLGYDLVHCRLLLVHLRDPAAAVQKLADSVAPGGALLLEEFEYGTLQVADPSHPLAATVTRVNNALIELVGAMGIDVFLGRRLPDLLEAAGLVDVAHEGTLRVTRGTAAPTMAKASTALMAPALVGRGLVSAEDVDGWFTALSDPTFRMLDFAIMSAWGRRAPL